jgi:hypothetical protein
MINSIIDAISMSVDAEFNTTPGTYQIYTESIEQGLEEPCFSIMCLNPTSELYLGKKYFRTNQFNIQYFPSTDEPRNECNDVLEKLYDCLETITVMGDLTRGSKMNGEIVDGVLNFFVNYDMFVYKVVAATDGMESMTVKSDVKG